MNGRWTKRENKLLKHAMKQDFVSWKKISQHVTSRNSKQCRERWNSHLDPTIKKEKFSEKPTKTNKPGKI